MGSMGIGKHENDEDSSGSINMKRVVSTPELRTSPTKRAKRDVRHLEIESRANPWKGLMLPLHQWRN